MIRKFLFILVTLVFITFNNATKAQKIAQNNDIPLDLSIKLVRGACYGGKCPVYELIIDANGNVSFNGFLNTKLIGKATDKVSKEQLKNLLSEFEKINFFSLNDTYAVREDGCTENWSHQSWEWITLKMGSKTKEIAHDFGCSGDAKKFTSLLVGLGKQIDETTNSKRWVGEQK